MSTDPEGRKKRTPEPRRWKLTCRNLTIIMVVCVIAIVALTGRNVLLMLGLLQALGGFGPHAPSPTPPQEFRFDFIPFIAIGAVPLAIYWLYRLSSKRRR